MKQQTETTEKLIDDSRTFIKKTCSEYEPYNTGLAFLRRNAGKEVEILYSTDGPFPAVRVQVLDGSEDELGFVWERELETMKDLNKGD